VYLSVCKMVVSWWNYKVLMSIPRIISRETPQSEEQEQRGNKTENGPAPSATAQAQLFGTPTTFPEPNGIVPASPCTGTVCPQYLASVNMMNSNASFLFGRGTDSAIWYREITDSSWNGDWKTLGGIFDSQPAAISMRDGRVDVFGTWKDDSTRYKTYQNGAWEGDWTSLSGVAKSQPVVCSIGWDNMIVSAIGMGNGVWRKMTGDGGESWDPNGRTVYWEENGGPVNKSLGTVCVPYADDSDAYFAEAGCGPKPDEELNYRMWNSSSKFYTNFTAWSAGGVPCMGDPTLVSFLDDITYFVVGSTDLAIWTFSALRSTGKITKTGMSLGGRFQSVVDVFTTGSSRMDLFAVGIDTRLKHMAYIEGKGWAPDWDDLGGYFNSAPKAVRLNDTAVAVFGIGPDGNIIHSVFSIGGGTDFVLGSQQWYTDGGKISTVIS